MLRINEVVVEVLGMLRPVVAEIKKHDRDLARQLRRCEDEHLAQRSRREWVAGGDEKGAVPECAGVGVREYGVSDGGDGVRVRRGVDPVLLDRLDRVRATFYKLAR